MGALWAVWRRGRRPIERVAVVLAVTWVAGCASSYRDFPYMPGGEIQRTHPRPMEGGYWADFDPHAVNITITPAVETNPVNHQAVFVATVTDKAGKPLDSRRVEWILSRKGVGDIVEVDESGFLNSRGYKVDNTYAVSHTNRFEHVLDRGDSDPSNDIHLKKGQTFMVITSPVEGTTFITAFAPGVNNWKKHKARALKHWVDAKFIWPPDACNRVGTSHTLTTQVVKASDGTARAGWVVRYKVLDGPAAQVSPAEAKTDASGMASTTLTQASPGAGVNTIGIEVLGLVGECGCEKEMRSFATHQMRKQWAPVELAVTKSGPATAYVCQPPVAYTIHVKNISACNLPAESVVVTDTIPAQMSYVKSEPSGQVSGQTATWSLGTLKSGEERTLVLHLKTRGRGVAVNTVTASATEAKPVSAQVQTTIGMAKLEMTKTGPGKVSCVGDPATFTITLKNTGDGPAVNTVLSDRFSAGLKHANVPGQTMQWQVGTLAPGESKTVQVSFKAVQAGVQTNTVSAKADCGATAQASAQVLVPLLQARFTKAYGRSYRMVNEGGKSMPERKHRKCIDFTLTLTNTASGPAAAPLTHAEIVDTIPAGTTLASSSSGAQVVGNTVSWKAPGPIAPGQSMTTKLRLRCDNLGVFVNPARATADCVPPMADEKPFKVVGVPGLLIEVVDNPDPLMLNCGTSEVTTYTIRVTNQGTLAAKLVQVQATVPPELKLVDASGATPRQVAGNIVTFAPYPSLAPGQAIQYLIRCKAAKPGDARFRVSMTADKGTLERPVIEEESTHVYDDN